LTAGCGIGVAGCVSACGQVCDCLEVLMMKTALGAPSRYCSVVLCLSAVGFCGDGWESLGLPCLKQKRFVASTTYRWTPFAGLID